MNEAQKIIAIATVTGMSVITLVACLVQVKIHKEVKEKLNEDRA